MLRNYFRIGLRNLLKNKLFSLINISGMAISIASFLIIALFVYDELKFDAHVKDVERKYRIYNEHFNDEGLQRKGAMIPPMIAPTLTAEYPEVEAYARFMNFNNPVLFEAGEKKVAEGGGGYADPYILEMFSLKLLEGDYSSALKSPDAIAINRTLKEKYFGDKPALGEVIQVFQRDFKVTAVFEDFPPHSHLRLNYFIAMEFLATAAPDRMQSWGWSQFHTYIQLREEANPADFEAKMKSVAEKHAWPVTKAYGSYYIPKLMPARDIHLHASDHAWDIAVRGNAQTVYILSATAVFILVIAILNFVNLSTARAISRVKEVGVRKVVGAFRSQLIAQFISESIVVAVIALLLGGLMTELSLPALNAFTEKRIPTGIFLNPPVTVAIFLFAILIGVAAGAYPAFYISSYRPANILGNRQSSASGRTVLRKALVVLQFILSFLLIIASLVVSEQHTYMRTKDMGFDKDNVIAIQLRGEMAQNIEATKQAFLNHPNIVSATLGYGLPGEAYAGDVVKDLEADKDWPASVLIADHDYVKTLGLDLIAGRDFSKDIISDTSRAYIISEAAARMLGYSDPAEALDHELGWQRWDLRDSVKTGRVIGIVRDFHLNSLRENITPVVLHIFPFGYTSLTMKVKAEDLPATIAHLEATWKSFNTEWPFEYRFLDDNFDKMYKAEEKLATLFGYFTVFTIFVACLGLFGLVVYSTTQKYREISIRKVLGAGEGTLVIQLARSYVVLLALAFAVAIPAGYYASNEWLEKFPFRIEVTALLFIKAALFIMGIALITVGLQSFNAARTNPVNALKEQ